MPGGRDGLQLSATLRRRFQARECTRQASETVPSAIACLTWPSLAEHRSLRSCITFSIAHGRRSPVRPSKKSTRVPRLSKHHRHFSRRNGIRGLSLAARSPHLQADVPSPGRPNAFPHRQDGCADRRCRIGAGGCSWPVCRREFARVRPKMLGTVLATGRGNR